MGIVKAAKSEVNGLFFLTIKTTNVVINIDIYKYNGKYNKL